MEINTGVHLRDLVPGPAVTHPDGDPHKASNMYEMPSESHALAVCDPGEHKGAAQLHHNQDDLVDLGWQQDPEEMPDHLIAGIDNEDLWTLIRRFDRTYLTAWTLDLLFPVLLAALITLIVSERARSLAFPPAPVSLVNRHTGGPTKPEAGVLGSTDSATGAPEHTKGEAVENEASNFVTGVAGIALNTLTAQDPKSQPENAQDEEHMTDDLPDPDEAATAIASAKDKAAGVPDPSQDKTKQPMVTLMWSYMRPMLHMLTLTSDTYERFTNTLLKGVPTNAQVAITLLRHAEANRCPLPPPPQLTGAPTKDPIDLSDPHVLEAAPGGDRPLAASDGELNDAAEGDEDQLDRAGGDNPELTSTQDKQSGKASKLLGLLKGGARVGVKVGLAVNKARSKVGTNRESAKNRLGAVPDKGQDTQQAEGGPVKFSGRWQGKQGFVCVAWRGGEPVVTFSDVKTATAARRAAGQDPDGSGSDNDAAYLVDMKPTWTVAVSQIEELKKHAGFGVKSKLAIGWALERDINDGLEIIDRAGESKVLMAVPKRDELFNRLCSMGGQKWELW